MDGLIVRGTMTLCWAGKNVGGKGGLHTSEQYSYIKGSSK